jgi:hypothetical protein
MVLQLCAWNFGLPNVNSHRQWYKGQTDYHKNTRKTLSEYNSLFCSWWSNFAHITSRHWQLIDKTMLENALSCQQPNILLKYITITSRVVQQQKMGHMQSTGHNQSWLGPHHHQWHTQDFFWRGEGSTNSTEDRGQREQRSGGGSPLVRGSNQFANE